SGARLGAAPRVRARRRPAGYVREAAAIRVGAGRADLRDRLHHVAIAAPTLLDPGVRRRGTDGAVRRPSYGGHGRPGPLRVRRGPARLPAAVSRPGRLRADFLRCWQPDPSPFRLDVLGGTGVPRL